MLAPLYEAAGTPLLDGMRATSFPDAAAMMPPPPPAISEMQVELFREIPDEAIDAAVEGAPGVMGIELRHWGGAMARPGEDAGPIGHRQVPFSVVAGGQADDARGRGAHDGRRANRRRTSCGRTRPAARS